MSKSKVINTSKKNLRLAVCPQVCVNLLHLGPYSPHRVLQKLCWWNGTGERIPPLSKQQHRDLPRIKVKMSNQVKL